MATSLARARSKWMRTVANTLRTKRSMPGFIVNLKDDASDQQVADAKQSIEKQGGTIKDRFTLIKGFSAEFPDDHVGTLEAHEAVSSVEKDGEMRTQ